MWLGEGESEINKQLQLICEQVSSLVAEQVPFQPGPFSDQLVLALVAHILFCSRFHSTGFGSFSYAILYSI
ncbi:hypothetical protein J6590_055635 [Homalodisca vitripennis]|nr:hypothetical protein J6590_055635 [Homalodisca vitripennis]